MPLTLKRFLALLTAFAQLNRARWAWLAVLGLLATSPALAARSACTAAFNTTTGDITIEAVDVGSTRYVVKLSLLLGGTVPRYKLSSATIASNHECVDAASVTNTTLTIPDIASADSFYNATMTLVSGTGHTQIDLATSNPSTLQLDLTSSGKNPRLVPDTGFRVQGASNPFATFNTATGVTYLGYQNNNGTPQAFQSATDGLTFSNPTTLTYSNRSVDSRRTLMPDGHTWRLYQTSPQGVMTSYVSNDGNVFTPEDGTRYSAQAADNGSIGVYDLYTAQDGALILIYLGDLHGKNNLRMAKSIDNGVTFTFVKGNVLGDDGDENGKYVDNKTIRLVDGRYRMLTMRNAQLQSFVTSDGYNWIREPGTRISERDFSSVGVSIYSLNDPVAVIDNTGALKVYVSAETSVATSATPVASSAIVSATWINNAGSGTLSISPVAPGSSVCTLNASPTSITTVGSSSTLTATCTPAATSYIWSYNTCDTSISVCPAIFQELKACDTTRNTCTVTPTEKTIYTVMGVNASGTGAGASTTVTVSTTTNTTTYTVPGTLGNDVFVLTASNSYYGGGGNDTYIISPNTLRANVTAKIIDTEGDNLIQLVDGMTVTASAFYTDAAQLTLSNGAKVQILGASKFKFQVGANAPAGDTSTVLTYTEFVTSLGASLTSGTLPASGTAGYVVPTGFTQAPAPVPAVAGTASTVPGTVGDDVIVPSGGNNYYGGGGNDTYIISPYTLSGTVTAKIIDTEGTNVIQFVNGMTIASSSFFNNAAQLMLSNGAIVQILGASSFSYQLGANAPAGETASNLSYAQFAATLGASVPAAGAAAVSGSSNFLVSKQ